MRMYSICTYKHGTGLRTQVEQTENNTDLLRICVVTWGPAMFLSIKNITTPGYSGKGTEKLHHHSGFTVLN